MWMLRMRIVLLPLLMVTLFDGTRCSSFQRKDDDALMVDVQGPRDSSSLTLQNRPTELLATPRENSWLLLRLLESSLGDATDVEDPYERRRKSAALPGMEKRKLSRKCFFQAINCW